MDIQKKLRYVAHFTVAKASDALETQRQRFCVRDIQKKQQLIYQELGSYIELHQELLSDPDEYVKQCFRKLENYEYKLHNIDSPTSGDTSMTLCPICGNQVEESANFCANCGSRLS